MSNSEAHPAHILGLYMRRTTMRLHNRHTLIVIRCVLKGHMTSLPCRQERRIRSRRRGEGRSAPRYSGDSVRVMMLTPSRRSRRSSSTRLRPATSSGFAFRLPAFQVCAAVNYRQRMVAHIRLEFATTELQCRERKPDDWAALRILQCALRFAQNLGSRMGNGRASCISSSKAREYRLPRRCRRCRSPMCPIDESFRRRSE